VSQAAVAFLVPLDLPSLLLHALISSPSVRLRLVAEAQVSENAQRRLLQFVVWAWAEEIRRERRFLAVEDRCVGRWLSGESASVCRRVWRGVHLSVCHQLCDAASPALFPRMPRPVWEVCGRASCAILVLKIIRFCGLISMRARERSCCENTSFWLRKICE